MAARASALSQWYPFTSHNFLRFVDGPTFWMLGAQDVNELAGSISFDTGEPEGRPTFRVWSGLLLRKPDPVLVLATPNAFLRWYEARPRHLAAPPTPGPEGVALPCAGGTPLRQKPSLSVSHCIERLTQDPDQGILCPPLDTR